LGPQNENNQGGGIIRRTVPRWSVHQRKKEDSLVGKETPVRGRGELPRLKKKEAIGLRSFPASMYPKEKKGDQSHPQKRGMKAVHEVVGEKMTTGKEGEKNGKASARRDSRDQGLERGKCRGLKKGGNRIVGWT